MNTSLILYRLSGWSQDIIWLIVCWQAIQRKWYWQKHTKYFFIFIITITVLELIYAITAVLMPNNLFLDYIYIPIEFILLGFFLQGIIKVKRLKRIVLFCSILFVGFQIYNAFWGEGLDNFNSYGAPINSFYLIILSAWACSVSFRNSMSKSLFKTPESWFVVGILLNFSSVIIFDLLYSQAVPYKNDTLLYGILITQNFLKCIFILFFLKGISLIRKL
jgi:hypothetical protein